MPSMRFAGGRAPYRIPSASLHDKDSSIDGNALGQKVASSEAILGDYILVSWHGNLPSKISYIRSKQILCDSHRPSAVFGSHDGVLMRAYHSTECWRGPSKADNTAINALCRGFS